MGCVSCWVGEKGLGNEEAYLASRSFSHQGFIHMAYMGYGAQALGGLRAGGPGMRHNPYQERPDLCAQGASDDLSNSHSPTLDRPPTE